MALSDASNLEGEGGNLPIGLLLFPAASAELLNTQSGGYSTVFEPRRAHPALPELSR